MVADIAAASSAIELTEPGCVVFGQPFCGQLGRDLLQDDAGLEDLFQTGVGPVQVEDGGVDDGVDGRLGHHQTTPGAAAHEGDLLVLDEAHGLAEDGAADAVALDQLGLRAEHLADRPAPVHDVGQDPAGHPGRQLLRRFVRGPQRHAVVVTEESAISQ